MNYLLIVDYFFQNCVVILEKLRNGKKVDHDELKPKNSRAPIEVLITPDGKVVSTSLDENTEIQPEEIVPQSEDQVENKVEKSSTKIQEVRANRTRKAEGNKDISMRSKSFVEHRSKTVSLKCGICQREFDTKSSYDDHMQRHTGKYRFSCDTCQKGFPRRADYNDHMMKHQGKFYCCQKCDKMFASRYGLRSHMQYHSGFRYKCDICQKGFAQLRDFQNHMMKHEGKSYSCQVCEKTFTTIDNLKRHMQHHTGKYRHTCKICRKGFVEAVCLREHMMKHEGKSFGCHICQKTFSTARNLQRHMKSHNVATDGK